ncbi:MAG: beta-ketoacyl-ACP reductase [Acidobacteria bacterium]|nr:MAG: beta-ketoacyl-ACP reductase [Acidobacteriota bacterium]
MNIENKLAMITGTKRIGRVVGKALAEKGADVVLTYNHSKEEAESAAREIRQKGRRAMALQADVSRSSDVQALVDRVSQELGKIHILINMASIYSSKPFEETTEKDWDANININLKSVFLCAKAAVPGMKAEGGGRIINFADWIAASGRPRYKGYLPYYVSKVGVIGLTEILALELAPYNILVNAIAPGPILAPPDLSIEEDLEVRKATPLGRWGGENEIAKIVLSLIETDFITGECIRVDGGRHIR